MQKLPLFKFVLPALLAVMLIRVSSVYSQGEKEKLQQKKSKIEEEINYTNQLLKKTKENRKISLNQLIILKNKIGKREELIHTINLEINDLRKRVDSDKKKIDQLKNELEDLKEEYAKMIYYAYLNRSSYKRLMFIFSAEDFNQAYQRLKYFQQYTAFRKNQVQEIQETQEKLNRKIALLEEQRKTKEQLLSSKADENKKLQEEKDEKNNAVVTLQQKEKQLKRSLRENEKAARDLQQAIERIIAEEIRLAAERASKSGTESNRLTSIALTPEEMELSNTFSNNKGKLPWPSERGIISGTFGEHAHPVLKGIKTKNNGIDILTNDGAHARAIYSGVVTSVMSIPNYNNVVIIRHGEFLSVYSNLEEVFVRRGDEVEIKESIGKVYTDKGQLKTELHFEMWQGKTLLNPQLWLAGKK
jgi:septal ring factor EnvC (AmiA/AmiB activator)